MRNCVCKTLPLAIAFLLVAVGVAFAGQNADVAFTQDTPAEFAGIGPGDNTVTFTVSAAGMVGVKQYDITIQVDPADAFDLDATLYTPGNAAFLVPGKEVDAAAGTVKIGAANLLGAVDGDEVLGTFTLTTAAGFTTTTEATITAARISLGPSSSDRDIFDAAALGLSATVNPPAPPPTIASIDPSSSFVSGGVEATIAGTNFQDGATATIGGNAAEVTATSPTSLTVTVPAGEVGAVDVVVTNPDAQSATLTGGFTYNEIPPVIEPTLSAIGATDASLDYSAGAGDVEDGSAGEVAFTVRFTDNTAAAAAGQAISWVITNNGSESVYELGTGTEVVSNDVVTIEVDTDAEGKAMILLDAQGDRQAGTTSVTVTASTTAPNSEDVSRDLGPIEFSATWDVPVAAELASFTSTVTPSGQVLLQWSVASQSSNLGWEIYRSTDNVAFERVGELVSGDGTTDAFKSYTFTDRDPLQAEVLYYYLKQIDLDGTSARSEVIEVVLAARQALPVANALWQNFPNPFNPETTINFELSEEAVVTLTVYDLTGQIVRTLVGGQFMTAGNHQSVWDGRNEVGVRVGSGVYLYRLKAGAFTDMKKMTLLQ